ncbi:hypothetical protein Psal071_03230 [Piscirickettsia salmonis]|uniref:Uncharacterized protein n=1 Tax=Piscirickettsia salmonis TaxID=1238 RepID=A0A9Q6LPE8_PISSA|nr:hypothetical protein [Piscirickettsia salmonis]QGN96579.1 hypothetical protein Psal006a_03229 [Piscirickettsia salmonis]QGO07521.1 hypothetical protein Psal009_03478 [Piscirickettsia salmonis]QGO35849.1 hypothetical protein Psal028_03231 [Piscirickettsia salmonis]QGO39467.1 hypothetical protein Psal040_03239 [Piscirickettsia salmonis]QGO43081.1 hypothetical protein Psal041_03227 [Piscirickettsia salmonis]
MNMNSLLSVALQMTEGVSYSNLLMSDNFVISYKVYDDFIAVIIIL